MSESPDHLPVLAFENLAAWNRWLAENHASAPGVWAKLAKKDTGIACVGYPDVLDEAICWGWIDGQRQALDETHYLQRFTPRGPRSKWSKINCAKVEALIKQGRMQPAGLKQVESAKLDGRWEAAYHSARNITVPEDFQAALEANPAAKAFFATLTGGNRYAVLYRIHEAKRPETRARRIEKFVRMMAEGKTLH